jgi:hypothetical protein
MNTNSSGIYCKFTNSKRKNVPYSHTAAKPKKNQNQDHTEQGMSKRIRS